MKTTVTGLIRPALKEPSSGIQVFAEILPSGQRSYIFVPMTSRAYPVGSLGHESRVSSIDMLKSRMKEMDNFDFYAGRLDTVEAEGINLQDLTPQEYARLTSKRR